MGDSLFLEKMMLNSLLRRHLITEKQHQRSLEELEKIHKKEKLKN